MTRPAVALFDYSDVFEDFYPALSVSQRALGAWHGSGHVAFARALQEHVGDVTWYVLSVDPELPSLTHDGAGCEIRFVRSSALHRWLWRRYYGSRLAWQWHPRLYRWFTLVASSTAPLSVGLVRALRRSGPALLVTQDYSSGKFDALTILAAVSGAPLVAYHAGSTPDRYVGTLAKRWTIPRAARILASSGREAEMLVRRFGVDRARVDVVLTPIDTDTFSPLDRDASCDAVGLDPERRYVLFVGRFEHATKRTDALVREFGAAASVHPDATLVLVGDGPDRAGLAAMASAADNVVVRPWADQAELARLYSAAECVVLPSWREGFPTVVGEALACGTPVVASDVGGVAELVRPGVTGWLVPPGDDAALRRALSEVLGSPAQVAAMRPAAREAAVARVGRDAVGAQLRETASAVGALSDRR